MKMRSLFLCMALCSAFASQAFAVDVPSSADPSRVEKQITPLPQKEQSIDGAGSVTGTVISAPPGAEKVTFILKDIKIEGVTAYDAEAIANIYKDKIGQKISLADVYGIADQLVAKYRNAGFILTQVIVPPQTIQDGHVRLKVVEGYIDDVRVEGEKGSDASYFMNYADKIRADKPLNSKKLERYLLLMNDMPGVSARAVLSPSRTKVGASDLTIIIDRKAFDVYSQLDNRGSRYLGPMQINVGTRVNNAFGLSEGISLQYVTTPNNWFEGDNELNYYSLGWAQPLNQEGTRLNISGSFTETQPGFELATFDVKGLSRSLTFDLSHPFIRTRDHNLNLGVRFSYLNSERKDNILVGKVTDRIRVLRVNGNYQFSDRWLGVNSFGFEWSKGLDVFNMKETSTSSSRARGNPQFMKFNLDVSRVQRLSNKLELFFDLATQRTQDILLASEEMGIGGARFGSAYDSSEITGEDAIAGRVELRVNNPIEGINADFVQAYVYLDGGKVWDVDNAVLRERRRSLSSTGLGLRANINPNIASTVELALPVGREVETQDDKEARVFGTLSLKF